MINKIPLTKDTPIHLQIDDETTFTLKLKDNKTIRIMANNFSFAVKVYDSNHVELIKLEKWR